MLNRLHNPSFKKSRQHLTHFWCEIHPLFECLCSHAVKSLFWCYFCSSGVSFCSTWTGAGWLSHSLLSFSPHCCWFPHGEERPKLPPWFSSFSSDQLKPVMIASSLSFSSTFSFFQAFDENITQVVWNSMRMFRGDG